MAEWMSKFHLNQSHIYIMYSYQNFIQTSRGEVVIPSS